MRGEKSNKASLIQSQRGESSGGGDFYCNICPVNINSQKVIRECLAKKIFSFNYARKISSLLTQIIARRRQEIFGWASSIITYFTKLSRHHFFQLNDWFGIYATDNICMYTHITHSRWRSEMSKYERKKPDDDDDDARKSEPIEHSELIN